MSRAPGADAAFGHGEPGRKTAIQALVGVDRLHGAADAPADGLIKVSPHLGRYQEHHAPETGADGVVHRIVYEELAAGTYRIYLLEPAVPAAQSGCEYYESGVFHDWSSLP